MEVVMSPKSPFSRLHFAFLSCALLAVAACDGNGTGPPAMPPLDTMPPPMVQKIAEDPAKSGSDVRLPWIVTDGGGRVREGDVVIAKGLTDALGEPIYCSFGPNAEAAAVRLTCFPMYPSAVTDAVANRYGDAACSDAQRLVVESVANRTCQVGKLRLAVLVLPGQDACRKTVQVREVAQVPVPTATWVMQNGRCVADAAGNPALNYFVAGRILDAAELPQGTRGIE